MGCIIFRNYVILFFEGPAPEGGNGVLDLFCFWFHSISKEVELLPK